MATLDELGSFLATACSLTEGTDLFRGQMPTSPDLCMAILEYGGREPDMVFSQASISVDYPRVQILVRGSKGDYATPRAKAETAYRAMSAAGAQLISGTRYLAMRPLQPPYLYEKDQNGRITVAFNAELQKALS